jgi:hypothetical protein
MELDFVTQFLSPIIVLACLCIGYALKHGVKNETVDSFIPTILGLVGIAANLWYTGNFTLDTVVAGAVSGLAAVGLREGFAQILKLPGLQQEPTPELEWGPAAESESPTSETVEENEEYHGKHFSE